MAVGTVMLVAFEQWTLGGARKNRGEIEVF
jgi:hypothetical protein